jgi:hypothetical protein
MLIHINGKFTIEQLYYYPDRKPQALEYCINREIYTLYTGAAGMLLHINGKFTIEPLYYYPDRNHKLCNIISSERDILHI